MEHSFKKCEALDNFISTEILILLAKTTTYQNAQRRHRKISYNFLGKKTLTSGQNLGFLVVKFSKNSLFIYISQFIQSNKLFQHE